MAPMLAVFMLDETCLRSHLACAVQPLSDGSQVLSTIHAQLEVDHDCLGHRATGPHRVPAPILQSHTRVSVLMGCTALTCHCFLISDSSLPCSVDFDAGDERICIACFEHAASKQSGAADQSTGFKTKQVDHVQER